jgi:hypothetical protein
MSNGVENLRQHSSLPNCVIENRGVVPKDDIALPSIEQLYQELIETPNIDAKSAQNAPGASPASNPDPADEHSKKINKKNKSRRKVSVAHEVWCFSCSRPGHIDGSKGCQEAVKHGRLTDFCLKLHWPKVSDAEITALGAAAWDPVDVLDWMRLLQIYHQKIIAPYESYAPQRDRLIREVLSIVKDRDLMAEELLDTLPKFFGDANVIVLTFLRNLSGDMATLRNAIEKAAKEEMENKDVKRGGIARWMQDPENALGVDPKVAAVKAFEDAVYRRLFQYGKLRKFLTAQEAKMLNHFGNSSREISGIVLLPRQLMPEVDRAFIYTKDYRGKAPLSRWKYPDMQALVDDTGLFSGDAVGHAQDVWME